MNGLSHARPLTEKSKQSSFPAMPFGLHRRSKDDAGEFVGIVYEA